MVAPYDSGEYGAPRRFEVAMALNRLRTLACEQVDRTDCDGTT